VKKPKRDRPAFFPSKDEIVAFVSGQKGKVATGDIARAFGLKNADRAKLKAILRELWDEGAIARGRGKTHHVGALPPVCVLDLIARDEDGELIGVPSEWDEDANGSPPRVIITQPRKPRPGTSAGVGDRALVRISENEDPDDPLRYSGRIIKVLDKSRGRLIGIFRQMPDGSGRLVPVDKKQMGRELPIAARDADEARDGDLVAVDLVRARSYGPPQARVKEKLGSLKSERAVSLIAIHSHDIAHIFPAAALKEAEEAREADLKGREDWRDLPLITIDPPDAKDHDDAVHAAPDRDPANTGGFILTVAIADVAHYVTPGSALDREALRRGNSVYFPDRVVPMLPERISNELCSLKPDAARGALAVRMVIAKDGRKISHTFHRILMRSAAKLHYAQAQGAIDGTPDEITAPLLKPILRPLYDAYAALKRARDAREPLDLDLPERKILLKSDGTVDRVIVPARLDAHRLIEECMILANVAAAETLEKARMPLIYRVHDAPGMEKVQALRELLQTMDINFAKQGALRPAAFNGVLKRVRGTAEEILVNEVVLRTQAQAEYAAENYGHFGLNLRRYAHFTSPIRRYADLIVHRALIAAQKLGTGALMEGTSTAMLGEVAAAISLTERRAMRAERETVDRLIAHHLADRIGATFTGRVSGVTRAGLFVKLDETGADGFIPASTVGDDYFRYEEARHALVGDRTGQTHRLGDAVEVKLIEAAPVAGALRFELLSEGAFTPRGVRAIHARHGTGRGASRKSAGAAKAKAGRGKVDKPSRPPKSRSGKGKRGKS